MPPEKRWTREPGRHMIQARRAPSTQETASEPWYLPPAPQRSMRHSFDNECGKADMARGKTKVMRRRRMAPSRATSKISVVADVPERAMVIFAHPDDAEIGSGGVVAKWVAAGCEVTYVLCTNGSAGTADRTLPPEQLAEQRAG